VDPPAEVHGLDALQWTGRTLEAERTIPDPTCDLRFCFNVACWYADCNAPCSDRSCETYTFHLDLPDGFWNDRTGHLEVSIRWPHETGQYALQVRTPDGRALWSPGGYYARSLMIADAAPGAYEVTVVAWWGKGPYEGSIQLEPRTPTTQAHDILPNLVTLPPLDLQVDLPAWGNLWVAPVPRPVRDVAVLAGVRGCSPDEVVDAGAKRCLRVNNRVANMGEGPLEVRLATNELAAALRGEGQFYQRIYRTDGTYRDVAVGKAYWHPQHAHLHYQGIAEYTVYHWDEATQTRGEKVNAGRKAGFCLVNEGLADPARLGTWPYDGAHSGYGCADPTAYGGFVMGIDPGWFDGYETYRTDQYVEITGVPDGIYEFVSRANAGDSLLESDGEDNEASLVFRLVGDRVEVLDVPERRK
jgi:hypothetical protein